MFNPKLNTTGHQSYSLLALVYLLMQICLNIKAYIVVYVKGTYIYYIVVVYVHAYQIHRSRRGSTEIDKAISMLLIFVLGASLIGTVVTSVNTANLNGTEGVLAGLFGVIFAIGIIVLGIGYIKTRRG